MIPPRRRLLALLSALLLAGCAAAAPAERSYRADQPASAESESDASKEDAAQPPPEAPPEDQLEESQRDHPGLKLNSGATYDDAAGGRPAAPEAAPPDQPRAPVQTSAQESATVKSPDFEGDVWEEESPHEALDALVQELQDELEGARKRGVTQNQLPGGLACEEVCDLSEGVCASSHKICAISARHPAEAYFADRCAWSQRECVQSEERCTRCAR